MLTLNKAPRGLTHYAGASPSVLSGIVLMAAFSAWLLWQDRTIFQGWAEIFAGIAAIFGLDGSVAVSRAGSLAVTVHAPAQLPDMGRSIGSALVTAVLAMGASFWLSPERVPARYGLRALALIVGLPALGYLALGMRVELDVEAHLAQLFKLGYWFLVLLPVLYATTAFVLPGNLAKRALWTLLAVVYFYFSVPVLALFHWQLLALAGLAWVPVLNILFSVLLLSLHLVAFYGVIASVED